MFDLSWSHILIVLIVALVVVGPKDLPKLMRIVGRWVAKARAMADQFRKSFDEMARQSELDELRQEIEALRSQRPLADIQNTLHQSILPPDTMPAIEPPKPESVGETVHTAAAMEAPDAASAEHAAEAPVPKPLVHEPGDVPPPP
jgi:sec-independent protein translocase protein TatB